MNSDHTRRFIELYFAHPIWKVTKVKPYIRACLAYSEYLKKERISAGSWDAETASSHWHYTDVTGDEDNIGELLHYIQRASKTAMHCYYNLNLFPAPTENTEIGSGYLKRVRAEDATNILFIGIDWDHSLPCGVLKIFKSAGIKPWALVQTSVRNEQRRYQALIAISPLDSRAFEELRSLALTAAKAFGSDPAVIDAARVFRLPGTINWKGAEAEGSSHAGYAELIDLAQDGEVYSLNTLTRLVTEFSKSQLSKQLQLSATEEDYGAFFDSVSKPRRAELTWQDALEASRKGEKLVKKGARHNHLLSWAGSLAIEVGRGHFSLAHAKEILSELAHGACETFDENDLRRLMEYLDNCHKKDKERRAAMLQELIDGAHPLPAVACAPDNVAASDHPGKKKGAFAGGETTQPLPQKPRTVAEKSVVSKSDDNTHDGNHGETEELTDGSTDEAPIDMEPSSGGNSALINTGVLTEQDKEFPVYALLQERLREFSAQGSLETEAQFKAFLVQLFIKIKAASSSAWHTTEVAKLLMLRAEALGLLHDMGFFLPHYNRTLWGAEARVLFPLNKEQLRSYFDTVLTDLLTLLAERFDLISDAEDFKKIRAQLVKDAHEDSATIDATGKQTVDEVQAASLAKKYIREYFQLNPKQAVKDSILKQLVGICYEWREAARGVRNNTIAFQNGFFDMESGAFTPCEAWRECRHAVFPSFHPQIAEAFKQILRQGAPKDDPDFVNLVAIDQFLSEAAPRFTQFMREAFPSDVGTWITVLSMLGYSLIPNNPFSVFFGFHGVTNTGKTTIADIACALVGSKSSTGLTGTLRFEDFAVDKGGVAGAVGKLAMLVDEAQSQDQAIHDKVFTSLKRITGSDSMTRVERKYEHAFDANIGTKFFLTSNPTYKFKDTGDAVGRRFIVLCFEYPAKKVDAMLKEKILSERVNFIVNECASKPLYAADILATIAATTCSLRWHLNRRMFEFKSHARAVGREVMSESMSPAKWALDTVLMEAPDKCVPVIVVQKLLEILARKDAGSIRGAVIAELFDGSERSNTLKLTGLIRSCSYQCEERIALRGQTHSHRKRVMVRVVRGAYIHAAALSDIGVYEAELRQEVYALFAEQGIDVTQVLGDVFSVEIAKHTLIPA